MYILCNIVQERWYVIFMQLCKATCTYICSWRIHEIKKKIPQNQYHIIHAEAPDPSADQVTTPMLHRHNSPVTSQHRAADIILYNVIFPSLCSIEQPSVFRMMSVFPDFCSDIFLLHIIYNFFLFVLFTLHSNQFIV